MRTKPAPPKTCLASFVNRYVLVVVLFLALPLSMLPGSSTVPDTEVNIPTQSDWIDYGTIFEAGAVGEWDHLLWGGFANSIIQKDGKYYLYYQGSEYYRTEYDEGVMWRSIGVAVSDDGVNFTKYAGNPVLTWFPNKNGEEGAVSSAVTLAEDGAIVLYYGANTEETNTTVNADARAAISQDGLHFEDLGVVLDHSNPQVWGYGDEVFPVDAIFDNGRWIVYYIPNGVPQSGKLGVAYGDQWDRLTTSSEVKSGSESIAVWGTISHAKVGEGLYALTINNIRLNTTEVRLLSIDDPVNLSQPVVSYKMGRDQLATLLLDTDRNTWFMFYQYEDGFGVKLAPAGIPDSSPPSAPVKLNAVNMDDEMINLSWNAAEDPDTGIVHYVIYRNGVRIETVKGRYFSDPDISEGREASYQVSAVNYHGYEGPKSAPIRVKKTLFTWYVFITGIHSLR
jgi:hypothetical protein